MQVFIGGLTHLDLHYQLVVLSPDGAQALHTWTYTTNWQCYPPKGPRLYTPLSFSLDPTGLTPTTLFGLTADSRSDLDSGLHPSLALTDKLLG